MSNAVFSEIIQGIELNQVVPYLGPDVLFDSKSKLNGLPIPADSDSLILAMNGGKPMAPKLMYEFPRAAMNQELKRGRNFVTQFLDKTYGEAKWTRAALHDWIAQCQPHYIIDVNRDTQLQESYANQKHTLIVGVARITQSAYRFKIFQYDGEKYHAIEQTDMDTTLPILFKPMGSAKPEATYIASDADYVDYITELMGGFAIPDFLKQYRQQKRYLLIGLPLNRDSERMVMSEIIYAAAEPKGWVLNKNPTAKEQRFCQRLGLQIINADVQDLLQAVGYSGDLAAVA